jgi:hypothetical protein
MHDRRDFLKAFSAHLAGGTGLAALLSESGCSIHPFGRSYGLIESVETSIIFHGRETGHTWGQARIAAIPGDNGRTYLFLAMQQISGSDYYGPVHFTISDDAGQTWSEPQPIPGLGQHSVEDDLRVGVCDPVPEYHPQTNSVLLMGHTVFYRGERFRNEDQRMRHTFYIVRRADGTWSPMRLLEWKGSPKTGICTTNCSQRVTFENGDVLIPLSFGEANMVRQVATVRCSFDGEKLRVLESGNALKCLSTEGQGHTASESPQPEPTSAPHNEPNPEAGFGRGLLEPSLARFGDGYYMTIRAEDHRGYVTTSSDGLQWAQQQPWCWQDGEPLTMSSTQQRWLTHSDGLYLVYTRKTEKNAKVFRWRAPLLAARVDLKTLRLMRDTEREIFPLDGDGIAAADKVPRMGNFHVTAFSPAESYISAFEEHPSNQYKGNTLLARVTWKTPNQLAPG